MCKPGFNFLQLYFSLPRVRDKLKLYRGKVDQTKKSNNKFCFLNSKLIHRHEWYLQFYRQKYSTKICLEHKTQVNATCDSSGPAQSSR